MAVAHLGPPLAAWRFDSSGGGTKPDVLPSAWFSTYSLKSFNDEVSSTPRNRLRVCSNFSKLTTFIVEGRTIEGVQRLQFLRGKGGDQGNRSVDGALGRADASRCERAARAADWAARWGPSSNGAARHRGVRPGSRISGSAGYGIDHIASEVGAAVAELERSGQAPLARLVRDRYCTQTTVREQMRTAGIA